MKTLKKRWRPALLLLAVAGMLTVIVRSAFAVPSVLPRPEDEVAAAREEEVPGPPGTDLRIRRPEGAWIGGLGVIEPATPEHRLAPAVGGRIAAIPVEEGQQVTAGTLLVQLESAAEEAALAAAEAEVRVAEAERSRTRSGARREEQTALERDADAARVRAENSQAVFDRLEAAAAGGGVTEDELDRARRQAEQDRLAAEGAASRLAAGRRGRPVDVRLADARLAAARARRDQARAALELLRIVAPRGGEILEIRQRVGEYVTPGAEEPVVVLGDTSSFRARVDIDERDLALLRDGARALVVVDALPDRQFEGRVVAIARRMGRKNVRTDEPTERIDTKILEVVVDLGAVPELIVGQRVMGYVGAAEAPPEPQAAR
jgi:HlyD family secretion protein